MRTCVQCWLKWGVFVLLAGGVLLSALLLFFTTPETKNVPLEQVSEVRGRLACMCAGEGGGLTNFSTTQSAHLPLSALTVALVPPSNCWYR